MSEQDRQPEQDEERRRKREKYSAYITSKWVAPVYCPICKHGDWSVGDVVDMAWRGPVPWHEGGITVYAMFPVFCTYCGYAMFVHTRKAETDAADEAEPS